MSAVGCIHVVEAELCLGLLHRQPSDGNAGVLEIAAEHARHRAQ
jgi:hypothetical protein